MSSNEERELNLAFETAELRSLLMSTGISDYLEDDLPDIELESSASLLARLKSFEEPNVVTPELNLELETAELHSLMMSTGISELPRGRSARHRARVVGVAAGAPQVARRVQRRHPHADETLTTTTRTHPPGRHGRSGGGRCPDRGATLGHASRPSGDPSHARLRVRGSSQDRGRPRRRPCRHARTARTRRRTRPIWDKPVRRAARRHRGVVHRHGLRSRPRLDDHPHHDGELVVPRREIPDPRPPR